MITPRFSLEQDDSFLIITIRAPYCNLQELETYIEGYDFRFVCSPFYLRLNLPGKILDDEASTGKFLAESGEFIFKYSKQNKGEHFQDLNFITSLLTPSKKKNVEPQIEVLSEMLTNSDQEGNEWHIEQKVPVENYAAIVNDCKYGFANQKCNILRLTEIEFYSVFDVHNADEMPIAERKNLRFDTESMDFCAEHYLADYFEDDTIQAFIKEVNPWERLQPQDIIFNSTEKDILKDFPNKEYLLDKDELKSVLCGLVDILFAYCYDKRTTDFEGTCESGWTITKLSAVLSWFDAFSEESETLTSAFRRSLIYPLYRNFELCNKVLEDLKILLSLGPVFIVKCLLDIHEIFNISSDPRYILNDLYIKDYIIFMQKCPKKDLEHTIQKVKEVKIAKGDLNLNLNKVVDDAIKGCVKSNDLLEKMSKLNISNIGSDSSDSDSDSDSSEETSSDSDDSSSDSDSTTEV